MVLEILSKSQLVLVLIPQLLPSTKSNYTSQLHFLTCYQQFFSSTLQKQFDVLISFKCLKFRLNKALNSTQSLFIKNSLNSSKQFLLFLSTFRLSRQTQTIKLFRKFRRKSCYRWFRNNVSGSDFFHHKLYILPEQEMFVTKSVTNSFLVI